MKAKVVKVWEEGSGYDFHLALVRCHELTRTDQRLIELG